jgi:hypothetical protein
MRHKERAMSDMKVGCPHHGTDALIEQGKVDYESVLWGWDMENNEPNHEGSTEYVTDSMVPLRVLCCAPAGAAMRDCGFVVAAWDDDEGWTVQPGARWIAR